MKAEFMTYVCEECALRFDLVYNSKGLIEVEMGDVLFALKGVQYQCFCSLHPLQGFGWDEICVGNITESAKTEPQYRKLHVHDRQGYNLQAVDPKTRVVDRSKGQAGDSRVILLRKSIGVFRPQLVQHRLCAIDRHVGVLHKVVCSHIVEPGRVITMSMREQDCIQPTHIFAQHLLPKVRSCVDDERLIVGLNEDRSP